jgi:hypothetical protein
VRDDRGMRLIIFYFEYLVKITRENCLGTPGPVIKVEFERIEALEVLGTALAHLNDAETRVEVSPRVPLLMTIRDKLARALSEEGS